MQARQESPKLDVLRSLAVLLVLAGHILQTLGFKTAPGLAVSIYDIAQTGVILFFVHTCLVLLLSLERMPGEGWRQAAAFWVRRLFRIYPLSLVVVAGMAALQIPAVPWETFHPLSASEWLGNLLLIQNLNGVRSFPGPLWSLPYELQMYAVLPLLFYWVHRKGMRLVGLLGLWLGVIVVIVAMRAAHLPGSGLLWYVPCFLGGAIAYALRSRKPVLGWWMLPLLVAALVALRWVAGAVSGGSEASKWVIGLVLGLALPLFREPSALWVQKAAAWIARYSYGIYLVQAAALWVAYQKTPVPWLALLALLTAVPWLLHLAVEQPMIRLGRRLADRIGA